MRFCKCWMQAARKRRREAVSLMVATPISCRVAGIKTLSKP
jgi:hypothetical protein